MNVYLFSAVVLLLPALCTALGAAGVFLVRRADEPRTRRMLCGMAAGIMLAASVWSLLLPAIERAEAGSLPVWLAPAATQPPPARWRAGAGSTRWRPA